MHQANPPGLVPHPRYADFTSALRRLSVKARPHSATTFRFTSTMYATAVEAASGEGAMHLAGRWNPKGCFRLVNTSPTPQDALDEVQAAARYYGTSVSSSFPSTVFEVEMQLNRFIDLTDRPVLRALRVRIGDLTGCDFRAYNRAGKEALTQAIWRAAWAEGYDGLLVPSSARRGARNLLCLPQNMRAGAHIRAKGL